MGRAGFITSIKSEIECFYGIFRGNSAIIICKKLGIFCNFVGPKTYVNNEVADLSNLLKGKELDLFKKKLIDNYIISGTFLDGTTMLQNGKFRAHTFYFTPGGYEGVGLTHLYKSILAKKKY